MRIKIHFECELLTGLRRSRSRQQTSIVFFLSRSSLFPGFVIAECHALNCSTAVNDPAVLQAVDLDQFRLPEVNDGSSVVLITIPVLQHQVKTLGHAGQLHRRRESQLQACIRRVLADSRTPGKNNVWTSVASTLRRLLGNASAWAKTLSNDGKCRVSFGEINPDCSSRW